LLWLVGSRAGRLFHGVSLFRGRGVVVWLGRPYIAPVPANKDLPRKDRRDPPKHPIPSKAGVATKRHALIVARLFEVRGWRAPNCRFRRSVTSGPADASSRSRHTLWPRGSNLEASDTWIEPTLARETLS
jgi:hypothetical protein